VESCYQVNISGSRLRRLSVERFVVLKSTSTVIVSGLQLRSVSGHYIYSPIQTPSIYTNTRENINIKFRDDRFRHSSNVKVITQGV
jgi:hypothetical protein